MMFCVFYMIQTLSEEKRVKRMGAAVPGVTHTILLLGGGECGPLYMSDECVIVSFKTETIGLLIDE